MNPNASFKIASASTFTRTTRAGFMQTMWMLSALARRGIELKARLELTSQRPHEIDRQALWNQFPGTVGMDLKFKCSSRNRLARLLPWSNPKIAQIITVLNFWRWQPRILFTRSYPYALWALLLRIPVVLELHWYRHTDHGPRFRRTVKWMLQRRHLIAVVATSEQVRQEMLRDGAPPSMVHTLPNAAGKSPAHELSRSEARKQLGWSEDGQVVAYLGGLQGQAPATKNVEQLVQAAAKLPGTRVVIVGGDRGEVEHHAGLAAAAGAGNVELLGSVPPTEVPYYQRAADVLVSTVQSDLYASPLKLIEYAFAHRPIVAPATDYTRHLFDDGRSALLYKPGSSSHLAECVQRLLGDAKLSRELADGALQRWGDWTWDARAKALLRITVRGLETLL